MAEQVVFTAGKEHHQYDAGIEEESEGLFEMRSMGDAVKEDEGKKKNRGCLREDVYGAAKKSTE